MSTSVWRPLIAGAVIGVTAWRVSMERRIGDRSRFRRVDSTLPLSLAEELPDVERTYRALFECLDKGLCILSVISDGSGPSPPDFRFLEVNPAFERHTGLRDVVGRSLREVVPSIEEEWLQAYARVARIGESVRFEKRARGLHRWFDVFAFSCSTAGQRRIGVLFTDISSRKHTEHALLDSEARSRLALDIAQLGTWSWRGAGDLLTADDRFRELCGFGKDEPLSFAAALAKLHPDDRSAVESDVWSAVDPCGDGRFKAEFRCLQPGGGVRWLVARSVTEFISFKGLQRPARMLGTVMDVTQLKKTERELLRARDELEERVRHRTTELARANDALRREVMERKSAQERIAQLLGQLLNAEEEERRRLSRELHDTLGQHLAVLSIGLKAVEADESCAAGIRDRLRQLSHTTRQLEDETDRLAYMLRPIELDSMGLADALTQYADNWSSKSGVAVDVHVHGLPDRPLPDAVDTTIYRVVQEALTNVSRHASASRVSLVIERMGKELRVIVEDDGRGFDPASPSFLAQRRSGLGLRGMAERAALLSGRLEVESMPGKGSTVYLSLPIEACDADLGTVAAP